MLVCVCFEVICNTILVLFVFSFSGLPKNITQSTQYMSWKKHRRKWYWNSNPKHWKSQLKMGDVDWWRSWNGGKWLVGAWPEISWKHMMMKILTVTQNYWDIIRNTAESTHLELVGRVTWNIMSEPLAPEGMLNTVDPQLPRWLPTSEPSKSLKRPTIWPYIVDNGAPLSPQPRLASLKKLSRGDWDARIGIWPSSLWDFSQSLT